MIAGDRRIGKHFQEIAKILSHRVHYSAHELLVFFFYKQMINLKFLDYNHYGNQLLNIGNMIVDN